MHYSTKTYEHSVGLSCCFRQWRAESHCRFLHGYALAFKFTFAAQQLDARHRVAHFGDLGALKKTLEAMFDHKTVIALDDPARARFEELHSLGLIDLRYLEHVGCEKFAEWAQGVADLIVREKSGGRVRCVRCDVQEHGANGAAYELPKEALT